MMIEEVEETFYWYVRLEWLNYALRVPTNPILCEIITDVGERDNSALFSEMFESFQKVFNSMYTRVKPTLPNDKKPSLLHTLINWG